MPIAAITEISWKEQRWRESIKVVANVAADVSEMVTSQVSVRDLKTHLSE